MEIPRLIEDYDLDKIHIATLGSHSALNILGGAKHEGFSTVCICTPRASKLYTSIPVADQLIQVDDFSQIFDPKLRSKLREMNAILIPHGSITAYLDPIRFLKEFDVPIFGNRYLIPWEVERDKQMEWLSRAGLKLPELIQDPARISKLVIAKLRGARGGRGYFLARSPQDFQSKLEAGIRSGSIPEDQLPQIQEYIQGVPMYPHYFRSVIRNELELTGIDLRYESDVDGISRIPVRDQLELEISPSFTVVGNLPVVAREALLVEFLEMGERVSQVSAQIAPPGIIGPFCLETMITPQMEIYAFEISARIVAGTNVWIPCSPYSYLKHGEFMFVGRRIAREIREALESNRIQEVVT